MRSTKARDWRRWREGGRQGVQEGEEVFGAGLEDERGVAVEDGEGFGVGGLADAEDGRVGGVGGGERGLLDGFGFVVEVEVEVEVAGADEEFVVDLVAEFAGETE
ncbi:hypothetical protein EV356DRAFT_534803 [Viridothelium virens]|uniref:Uncharacterized protein n=1 Tax=Viridothelium virens TaxID=1048519 RepID=A0A6A6H380_VIRVR|nr:hypothetical protein EV356DRAFT_534803 [Viridothelium virens]